MESDGEGQRIWKSGREEEEGVGVKPGYIWLWGDCILGG